MVEPLFQAKVRCPQCVTVFTSPRVRPSFKKTQKSDTDFCMYYKDVNPEYYVVRVCPSCGFAFTENSKQQLTPQQRKTFQEKIGSKWTYRDLSIERSWEEAVYVFKLALLCAQVVDEHARVTAGLLHHIAWLYREKGDVEQETRFLQYALDEYVRTFETEGAHVDNARLMYLIGELNRRLKNYNQAVKWFSRVINDKNIMDAGMIRACREQWAVVREDMLAENIQPEEQVLEQ